MCFGRRAQPGASSVLLHTHGEGETLYNSCRRCTWAVFMARCRGLGKRGKGQGTKGKEEAPLFLLL